MKINIAIDGPGAAGKSTISKLLAKKFGYAYLDTGAMYRCCGYEAYVKNIDTENEKELAKMMDSIQIDFDSENHVYLDGKDVSEAIRTNENGMRASLISQKAIVRSKLVDLQRKIASGKGYILDGRDIGTVVLPDAELKIYLVASVESRAQRRYKEIIGKGLEADFDEISKDLIQRDYQDMNREVSPLRKAEDAIEVDTSDMSIEEVVNCISALFEKVITERKP